MQRPLLMKLGEVKRLLGMSREKIYRLAERGEIRAVSIGGQRMYNSRSVYEWIDRQGLTE